jgi:hypothetical protein
MWEKFETRKHIKRNPNSPEELERAHRKDATSETTKISI